MNGLNGPHDPFHEQSIVSQRVTQRLGLFPKDIEDGLGRLADYEPVEDLMLDQVRPSSDLEFIQSGFKERIERSQPWRWMNGHGDEGTCLVVKDRWEDCERCYTADNRPDTIPVPSPQVGQSPMT